MRSYAIPLLPPSAPPAVPTADEQLQKGAELLTAIGHAKRLAILRVLVQRELCVCELQGTFGWSQSLISHHLAVLRAVGLVRDRRDAQWVYYSVVPPRLAELRGAIGFLMDDGPLPAGAVRGANRRCCS